VALRGIMNVLAAAEGKDFFLVSSSEVYQSPGPEHFPTGENVPLSVPDVTNPRYSYGGGKIACEIAALAYSDVMRRTVIVRPHNIYGPDMGWEHVIPEFAQRLAGLRGQGVASFPIQGTGQETRSFCFVDDCVDALMLLLERGEDRNIYHIGTDQEVSISELAHLMASYFGLMFRVEPGKLPQGSPPRRLPDLSKMRAIGYEPTVKLSEGLVPTLDWYEHWLKVVA
jgi:nucleoside-diphosphate-sugar epimerase